LDGSFVRCPATGEHTETKTANTDTVYGYDGLGRLASVTVNDLNGTTLSTPLVTTYGYDGVGNKISESLANGVNTTYTYNDLNRLTGVTETQGATTLFTETYSLNDDGTRSGAVEWQRQLRRAAPVTVTIAWGYDAMDRLTSESFTSSGDDSYTDAFTYDKNSNRMNQVHTDLTTEAVSTNAYTYNGDDELTQQVNNASGASQTTNLAYDANGSEISSTTGSTVTSYGYDVRNKMIDVAVTFPHESYQHLCE
jgi:YD repeat-containing protein